MIELKRCEHCSEGEYIVKVNKFWHKITPGLVHTLVKVYKRVVEKNQNIVHMNELELDHSEYGNFQKLRFHALIAKLRKDGQTVHRSWVITKRGAKFLRGERAIPGRVRTLLNRVIEHGDVQVKLIDVMRNDTLWETYEDFASQIPMVEFSDPEVDIDSLKEIKSKKKKGKKLCSCGEIMKIETVIEKQVNENTLKIKTLWKCTVCGAEENIA